MRTIRAGQIQSLFAGNIRKLLEECVIDYEKLYEIRLRTGRPVFLCYGDGEKFLRTGNGMPYRVTRQDLKETLEYISGYSLYAYEDEICQGYLSVQGGHRVGITGKAGISYTDHCTAKMWKNHPSQRYDTADQQWDR